MKRFILRIGLGIVMGGLLWGGLLANPAMADLFTFNFTGAVGSVDTELFTSGSNFNAGQTLSGSYTFQSSIGDSNSSMNIGRYNGTITALTVNLGPPGYTATLTSPNSGFIEIRNQSSDRYIVQAPVTGMDVNEYSPLRFRIELIDPSGKAFANDFLPTTPPSLDSFARDHFRFVFEDSIEDSKEDSRNGRTRVQGNLLTLTAVPLPTAVILFGAGLVALVGLGAGSWRKRNNSLA